MSKELEKRLATAETRLANLEEWLLRQSSGRLFKLGTPYTGNDVCRIFESGSSLLNPAGQFVQLPAMDSRAFVRCGYIDDDGKYQNSGWQDWPYIVRNNVPGAHGWQRFAGNIVPAGAWIEFNPAGIANALELPFQRLVSVEFGTILPLEIEDGLLVPTPEPEQDELRKSVLGDPKDSEEDPQVVVTLQIKNTKSAAHVDHERVLPDDIRACFVCAGWWQHAGPGASRQHIVDWVSYTNIFMRKTTGKFCLEYKESDLLAEFRIPEDAVNICIKFGVLLHKPVLEDGMPYPRGYTRR